MHATSTAHCITVACSIFLPDTRSPNSLNVPIHGIPTASSTHIARASSTLIEPFSIRLAIATNICPYDIDGSYETNIRNLAKKCFASSFDDKESNLR